MDYLEILLIVGSIVLCILFAAVLTCFISMGCNWRAKAAKNTPYQSPPRNNDYDVEAQRETYNEYSLRSSASRNVYTSNHTQPSYIQQSRPKPMPSNSGTRPPGNAAQSNSPNLNLHYHDETLRNMYVIQNQQNLSRKSGIISTDTRQPVSVMKPSQQEKDINSRVKFTKYAVLDLHFLRLNEAMDYFKCFLLGSIEEYKNSQNSKQKRYIEVITGRGKHTPDGIPVIKPAVESYLIKHQYKFNWSNPGMVRIDLLSVL